MQAPSPSPQSNKTGTLGFSSLGSDATAVSNAPVDETGFKVLFGDYGIEARRGSEQSASSAGVQSLPQLAFHPPQEQNVGLENPYTMQSPNDARDTSDGDHVQFARYPDEKLGGPTLGPAPKTPPTPQAKTWVPHPLRPWFWIPFVLFLLAGAIGLEVALHFSNKNQGWSSGDTDRQSLALHYVYTLPPVIVASILVAMWAWTDVEVKKIQPYVDLVHGDAPPHRSLLLDYTRHNNFFVWTHAASNRHYLVALASLMVILSLSFQPLAAALLQVKDTWWQEPDVSMNNRAVIGLNQDPQFQDLTYFLAAAGYSGSMVMYDLAPPAFVKAPYAVAPFELPTTVKNGTAFANTTAIKSETGCERAEVNMSRHPDGSGWTNSASLNGCNITWEVDVNSRILFGTDTPTCADNPAADRSPVVFWYFSYIPAAIASATFCYPRISLLEVNVGVDVATGNVTRVAEIGPLSSSSSFSSQSGTVTGAPLFGQAYNGINFNFTTNPDRFILARQNATQLQLPAAVFQAATLSDAGFSDSFDGTALTILTDEIYSTYLSLVARSVYFVPDSQPINVQVKTFKKRVWLTDVAVHLLATAMILLAFFATIIHLFHREERRDLHLKHEPGTIASAVSIGAQTGVGEVLAGRHAEQDIAEALKNKRFRIDPATMKIIMEGEFGYEQAKSPQYRRSIFAINSTRRRRRSTMPDGENGTPPTSPPRTPKPKSPTTPTTSPDRKGADPAGSPLLRPNRRETA
ncbi:hypothetical protein NLJ89_g444 [Agrocybe chaxingu]|uniref:Uncharacterized protein n=1 Tax=Agrocybe chaxingu TaxID=84603 RepID=A0A9W8N216_9AGAR|nr:hypothetical protein NLJ89_g444 [Agrocybe chaxingu]